MAAARKIKRSRKSRKSSVPFLPESLQAFIARRLVDLVALSLVFAAGFMTLSLITYNSEDPSWNTAASQGGAIENAGSWVGAWLSDVLLQTLGGGSFILALGIGIWGGRIFKRISIRPVSFRFAAMMVASLLTSVALAPIPAGSWSVHPYLGSSAGTLILNNMSALVRPFYLPYEHTLIAATAGFLAFGAFLYAAVVSRDEISAFIFRIKVIAFTISAAIMSAIQRFYGWIMHYNDPAYEGDPVQLGIRDKLAALREQREERRAAAQEERELRRQERQAEEDDESEEDEYEEEGADDENEEYAYEEDEDEDEEIAVSGLSSIPVVKPQQSAVKKPVPKKKPAKDAAQQTFALSGMEGEWELPPLSMIQEVPPEANRHKLDETALRRNAELLQNVLADFKIKGDIVSISPGPVVTLYELEPAPGTRTSQVIGHSDDIARSMSAVSVRCAVVPGRNVIGIELPNKERQTVYMREMLSSRLFETTSAKLPLILGKDIGGQPILADLAKMPHLLVAGTTGSGKSVAVNTMIMSLLYRLSPEQCRFIMIDPKMLELSVYDDIPHLLSPVVTEPGKAVVALKWAVLEMENRYRNMSKLGVRNIEGYNQRIREALKKGEEILHKVQTGFEPDTGKAVFEDRALELVELPYIVVIVDEFADLMLVAGKDVENAIQRLAQMARAAGIHLIMATQRPSVDVITGVIKANFPTRISFQVTSKIDSRTILGESGAEQLLGMGDMLYMAPGGRITRVHGPFVSDADVEKTTSFLRAQATPSYLDSITEGDDFGGGSEVMNAMFGGGGDEVVDELYDKAVAVIAREGKVSTSFIQRHLQIGYNRAARIVEEMERQGVISPANSVGKREILIRDFSDV